MEGDIIEIIVGRPAFCALVLVGSMFTAPASAQGWAPAAQDRKNTIQSCAAMSGDDYVCAFIRCDAKGILNFYAAAPGADIEGNVVMDIDGQKFPMTFRSPGSPHLASTSRADPLPPDFIAALKAGKVMKIRGAGLKAGYDTIPLRKAEREIGRIEKVCGITPAVPSTGARTQAPEPTPLTGNGELTLATCKAEAVATKAKLDKGESASLRVVNDESRSHRDRCSAGRNIRQLNANLLKVMLKCDKFLDNTNNIEVAREVIQKLDSSLKMARCT